MTVKVLLVRDIPSVRSVEVKGLYDMSDLIHTRIICFGCGMRRDTKDHTCQQDALHRMQQNA